jgi:hypothetical protein
VVRWRSRSQSAPNVCVETLDHHVYRFDNPLTRPRWSKQWVIRAGSFQPLRQPWYLVVNQVSLNRVTSATIVDQESPEGRVTALGATGDPT